MKVCLVNVGNCINYSQYGMFFFENIKNNDCVIYNDVSDISYLSDLRDFLIAEYNRNAFLSDKIRLIFLVSRDMSCLSVKDREFYVKINIYKQIVSQISFFSSVDIIFIDKTTDNAIGERHRRDQAICEYMMTSCLDFADYLPSCDTVQSKEDLREKIDCIKAPLFKEFAIEGFARIPDDMESTLRSQLEKIYASNCAKMLENINTVYELVKPDDVSDRISDTIKVIYFLKSLFSDVQKPISRLKDFSVNHADIKVIIRTYKRRLEDWKNSSFDDPIPEEIDRYEYIVTNSYAGFCDKIQAIIDKNLVFLERIDSHFRKKPDKKEIDIHDKANKKKVEDFESVVDETFEKLDKIVKHSKDEVTKFAQTEAEYFFNENVSRVEEKISIKKMKKIDIENEEDDLLENMNRYDLLTPPGMTEIIRLEQRLEKINEKIHQLIECKKVYKIRLFLLVFLVAFISVIGIYLGVQAELIIASKAFLIFILYALIVGVGFYSMYMLLMNFYKKQIFLLLKKCKEEVEEYLDVCKKIAADFEKNVNALGKYICHKEFLEKIKSLERERDLTLAKYEWHCRKVEDILSNINHFNDYIKGVEPIDAKEDIVFEKFDEDAEHTEFYQMKLFVKGK